MRYADNFCTYTEEDKDGEHLYHFTGPYFDSAGSHTVTIKGPDLFKYRQGTHIQEAFPYLSDDDREFLMSGFSPEGWKKMFNDND